MTGRLKGCRPYIMLFFSVCLNMSMASGLWGKEGELSHHLFHRLQALPMSGRPGDGDYYCRGKKKKSSHTVEIISAVWLAPPPSPYPLSRSLSLSLSHSLCEAPADSGCIHPYINHSPYSIGYMVHGKYWFFPLPHCWRTLGFCETEKGKTKNLNLTKNILIRVLFR